MKHDFPPLEHGARGGLEREESDTRRVPFLISLRERFRRRTTLRYSHFIPVTHVKHSEVPTGHAREDLRHFGRCDASQVFGGLQRTNRNVADDKWDRFTLFALLPSGKIPDIWVDLHLLLWK